MTPLGITNFILQIFFIRITKVKEHYASHPWEVSLMPDGSYEMGYSRVKVVHYWAIMYWVVPFTGWWSQFRYVGRRGLWPVTSPNTK